MEFGLKTRQPAVAGSFYPADPRELTSQLDSFFQKTKKIVLYQQIKALIVPHAGYLYSGQTAAWGYRQLPQNLKNPHFVLIGPSHYFPLHGVTSSAASAWKTPLGTVPHIPASVKKTVFLNEDVHLPEHSLEVQLPFLQHLFPHFSLTCLLTGEQHDSQKLADYFLTQYPSARFIVSSDLSHYLSRQEAERQDQRTIEAILACDNYFIEHQEDCACGRWGIATICAMARAENWERRLIFSDTSATASGDTQRVVGYAAIAFLSKV